jgi:NTPase
MAPEQGGRPGPYALLLTGAPPGVGKTTVIRRVAAQLEMRQFRGFYTGEIRATAAKFEVSISFAIKLMRHWLRRGTVQPDRIGGWKWSTLAAHAERVRALVAAQSPPYTRRAAEPAGSRGDRGEPVERRPFPPSLRG